MSKRYRYPVSKPAEPQYQYTIEMAHGKIWTCQRGFYGYSSVLAGQPFRQLLRCYDQDLEKAKAENPGYTVDLEGVRPEVFIPQEPPDWFDEANAGERWSEDY